MSKNKAIVLMFHSIITAKTKEKRFVEKPRFEMTVEWFKKIIEYFKDKGYHFLSLDELYDRSLQGTLKDTDHPYVCITFDDGYADFYLNAYPLLAHRNIPFTIYLSTGYPDQKIIHISEAIEDMVRTNQQLSIKFNGTEQFFVTTNHEEKVQAFQQIEKIVFRECKNIKEVIELLGIDPSLYYKYGLNWVQLKEISENPLCTLGAHTVTHPDLTKLNLDELKKEIVDSKLRIENMIQKPVNHFAYPFGRFNNEIKEEVASIGFSTITTTKSEIININKVDWMEIPRVCAEHGKFISVL